MSVKMEGLTFVKFEGDRKHVFVSPSATDIANGAFAGTGVEHVTIPQSVRNIGSGAFRMCGSLVAVDMPESMEEIGACAFEQCWQLERIDLPDGIEYLGHSLFRNCYRLQSVSVPPSVKTVHDDVFFGCKELRRLRITTDQLQLFPAGARQLAALTYMCEHESDAPAAAEMEAFIEKHARLMADLIINRNEIPAMLYMVDRGLLANADIDWLIDMAGQRHRPEICAILLDAKNQTRSSASDDAFDWDPFA